MLEFIAYLVKYSAIFACNMYVFAKITASRLKYWDLFFIPLFIAFSFALYFVTLHVKLFVPLIILILTALIFLIRFKQPLSDTVTLSMISFGITIFSMVITTLVLIPLLAPIYVFVDNTIAVQAGYIIQGLALIVLTIIAFQTKRLKNSLTPAANDEVYERLLLASVVCIFSMTLFYTVDSQDSTLKVIAIIVVFCGLVLISQWRKTVTAGYYKKLEQRNLSRLELILEQYERNHDELIKKNAELAKIIHRDNKLLPAMRLAVSSLAQKYSDDKSIQILLNTLENVYAERTLAIENYGFNNSGKNKSGVLSIDAVMDYFRLRAAKNDVKFEYEFDAEASLGLLNIYDDHTQLNTILCDLAENALISLRGREGGKVFLQVKSENGAPCIKVFDNGEDFSEKVLRNMGRRNVTTHAHEGGSGIGLMALFDSLRARRGSFFLDETPANGFTKCVCIRFDGKDSYSIKSARPCVKRICAERENFILIDTQIYEK